MLLLLLLACLWMAPPHFWTPFILLYIRGLYHGLVLVLIWLHPLVRQYLMLILRGETNGSWVFPPNRLFAATTQCAIKGGQSLRYVINPTMPTQGYPCEPLTSDQVGFLDTASSWPTTQYLDWDEQLDVNALNMPVLCWSIFSSTGWTIRTLTMKDLLAAYDKPGKNMQWPGADNVEVPIFSGTINYNGCKAFHMSMIKLL